MDTKIGCFMEPEVVQQSDPLGEAGWGTGFNAGILRAVTVCLVRPRTSENWS